MEDETMQLLSSNLSSSSRRLHANKVDASSAIPPSSSIQSQPTNQRTLLQHDNCTYCHLPFHSIFNCRNRMRDEQRGIFQQTRPFPQYNNSPAIMSPSRIFFRSPGYHNNGNNASYFQYSPTFERSCVYVNHQQDSYNSTFQPQISHNSGKIMKQHDLSSSYHPPRSEN